MHQFQRSRVRPRHPSAQWNLRAADKAVLNIVRKKKFQKYLTVVQVPDRYASIATLDEELENEKWTERTELITRLGPNISKVSLILVEPCGLLSRSVFRCSLQRSEGFSWSLNVLHECLGRNN